MTLERTTCALQPLENVSLLQDSPILLVQLICVKYRYTPDIPEPAPSLSRPGAQIVGLWVFLVIKITAVRQV